MFTNFIHFRCFGPVIGDLSIKTTCCYGKLLMSFKFAILDMQMNQSGHLIGRERFLMISTTLWLDTAQMSVLNVLVFTCVPVPFLSRLEGIWMKWRWFKFLVTSLTINSRCQVIICLFPLCNYDCPITSNVVNYQLPSGEKRRKQTRDKTKTRPVLFWCLNLLI